MAQIFTITLSGTNAQYFEFKSENDIKTYLANILYYKSNTDEGADYVKRVSSSQITVTPVDTTCTIEIAKTERVLYASGGSNGSAFELLANKFIQCKTGYTSNNFPSLKFTAATTGSRPIRADTRTQPSLGNAAWITNATIDVSSLDISCHVIYKLNNMDTANYKFYK